MQRTESSLCEMIYMKPIAAKLVRFLHLIVFIFIAVGWAIPWWQVWAIHVPFVIFTRIHWRLNQRTCIFTTWEVQLKGEELVEEHEEGWFVKEVFESVTGWRPSTLFTRRLMVVWMYGAMALSIARLWSFFG
ncbi:MAG TPA: DUF2784 family protein [Candidatus Poseidoniales archaeon]|nr:DUF2784 family protein [Candidatus Poseidoniales archaeon]